MVGIRTCNLKNMSDSQTLTIGYLRHWCLYDIDVARRVVCLILTSARGIHPPEAMMHFPLFQIPPILQTFSDSVENVPNVTYSKNNFDFHPPKFLVTFLVIDSKFWIPPIFAKQYISQLISGKLLLLPTFLFSMISYNLRVFYILYHTLCFSFPLVWPWCIYASHNAHTGRPWQPLTWRMGTTESIQTVSNWIIVNIDDAWHGMR